MQFYKLKYQTLKFDTGKVRDIYDLGDKLIIAASDRLSAFDVIMKTGIPCKGVLLTQISKFWFDFLGDTVENHVISTDVNDFPQPYCNYKDQLIGRSMLIKKNKGTPRRMYRKKLHNRIRLERIPTRRNHLRNKTPRRTKAMPETR